MLQHLLRVADDKGIREFILDAPGYSIGRDPRCDIQLFSQFISRRHATLVRLHDDDDWGSFFYRIVDGNAKGRASANGLFVNGQRRQGHNLQPLDEIELGHARLVYYMGDSQWDSPFDENPPSDPNSNSPRQPSPLTPNAEAGALPDEGMSAVP